MTTLTTSIAVLACAIFLLPLVSGDLISETCSQTSNEHLCLRTLRRDNRSRDAKDIAELALVVVDALKEKANATREFIKGVQKSNLKLANALMICNENYFVIMTNDIPKAEGSLRQNPRLAEHGMSDAVTEAQGCDESFDEPMDSPVSDMNRDVADLSSVALSIIRIMMHKFD